MRCSWLLVLVACGAPRTKEPAALSATPSEGIAIAIYATSDRSYAVVDDRRWIDVSGETVMLDRIDPASPLQSLVIESLDARDPIRVTACVRERVDDSVAGLQSLANARGERPKRLIVVHGLHDDSPERFHFEESKQMEPAVLPDAHVLSPIVRCKVVARSGKHLVRVLHVTSTLGFRTMHDVVMAEPERAQVATRFAIRTPSWGARAEVTLFEGLPGDDATPRELARGPLLLDGSTAILAIDPRIVPARMRSIYDGAKLEDGDDVKPNDLAWARESRHQVWVWLEVTAQLASGPIRAHVELPNQPPRDAEVAAELRERTRDNSMTRFPLWIDEDLLGTRHRTIERADGVVITDRVQLTISNVGNQSRDVWIEERLRPSPRRRALTASWPARPLLVNDLARTKLTLAPGQTERLGFTIDYEF